MNRLAILAMASVVAYPAASLAQGGPSQDSYIVVLKSHAGAPADVAAELAQRTNGRVGYVYEHALQGFSISVPPQALAALENNPNVAYIEKDKQITLSAQTIPTGIKRSFADTNPNIGIDGVDDYRVNVDVAVLDTGIDTEHPDLNVVGGANCLQASKGPAWRRSYYCDANVSADDDHYHGTHVAGTIGAMDNSNGVVGVAPGARLWAVKVLDAAGSGYTSGIIAGIDWVVGQGNVEVINMSLGGQGVDYSYRDAIDNARNSGVVTVVAAGNEGLDANGYSPAYVPNAITVSALADFDGLSGGTGTATCRGDGDDTLANFSNWGSAVDIAAPGVCILSTFPMEQGAYGTISGTSMAAPHVAGAAALLASGPNSPQNAADVDLIRDTLVNSGNFDWTDDSGDGIKEPLLDLAAVMPTDGGALAPNALPTADFNHSCSALSCGFNDASTDSDGSVTAWAWSFGDGATSTAKNPSHSYAAAGTYTVTLTVTDNEGGQATVSHAVTVSEPVAGGEVTVSGMSPDTMSVGSTINTTISGSGFVSGATVTAINGSGATPEFSNVVVVDSQTITATVSVKSGGPRRNRIWDIVVTNPDGGSATLVGGLTVLR